MSTLEHSPWPPPPPSGDDPELQTLFASPRISLTRTRRRRAPITMPVLVMLVLVVAAITWLLFYRIAS